MEPTEPSSEQPLGLGPKQAGGPPSTGAIVTANPRNVVAVVVTRDPGPWFEDTLASLAAQDHDGLSILVIDDGSAAPVTGRVADVMPSAFVRRHDRTVGFGAAANQVLEMVQGAAYLLFCHDDVALAPDAVRLLVDEAVASSLDLAGPKIVAWDDHERLLSVGLAVDRIGDRVPVVDRLELDQGQHDVARDVLSLSGAALLVRSGAFAELGGFDADLTASPPSTGPDVGEDVDLCWRARQRRFRLGVQPAARVAHLAAAHGLGPDADPVGASTERTVRLASASNRVRSMLTTATSIRVPFVVPLLLAQTLIRSVADRRRTGASLSVRAVWAGALRDVRSLRSQRSRVQSARLVSDRELLEALPPSGALARAALRAEVTADTERVWNVAERTVSDHGVPTRGSAVIPIALGLLLLFGSRRLVFGRVPVVGQFAELPSAGDLWRLARTGWREAGVGIAGVPPAPALILAVLSSAVLGATGLLRTLLTVGMLPTGALGIWRLSAEIGRTWSTGKAGQRRTRPVDVRVGQVTALAAYGLAPLVYDAISRGRLDGCIAYGTLPWLMLRVLRLSATHRRSTDRSAGRRRSAVVDVIRLAVPLAVATALAPGVALVFGASALALGIATALLGERTTGLRILVRGGAALAGSVVLLAPWVIDLLGHGRHWSVLTGGDQSVTLRGHPADLAALHVGDIGGSPLRWAILLPAVLPLLVADGARLRGAARAWSLVISGSLLLWLAGRGWLGLVVPHPSVALAPVAVGLALSSGMGMAGFVADTRSRRFGWRQAVSAVGLAGVVVASVPVVLATGSGRWRLPSHDLSRVLGWMPDQAAQGGYRTLWIGSPDVLPLAGVRIGPDLAMAGTLDGLPDASDGWGSRITPGLAQLRSLVESIRARGLSRAGNELAAWGVRYVVLLDRAAPSLPQRAIASDVQQGFDDQLDLRQLESERGVRLYENAAWSPVRIAVPLLADSEVAHGVVSPADALRAQPVLRGPRHDRSFTDTIPRNSAVVLRGETADGWRLRVGSTTVERVRGADATAFVPPVSIRTTGGEQQVVRLGYKAPIRVRLAIAVQAILWCAAFAALVAWRPLRRVSGEELLVEQERRDSDIDDGDRFGDPFRTSFAVGSTEDDPLVEDAERGYAAFEPVADRQGGAARVGEPGDDLPEDGSLADELWERWSQRHGRGEADVASSRLTPDIAVAPSPSEGPRGDTDAS